MTVLAIAWATGAAAQAPTGCFLQVGQVGDYYNSADPIVVAPGSQLYVWGRCNPGGTPMTLSVTEAGAPVGSSGMTCSATRCDSSLIYPPGSIASGQTRTFSGRFSNASGNTFVTNSATGALPNTPVCGIVAPASVMRGQTFTASASCSPQATAFNWVVLGPNGGGSIVSGQSTQTLTITAGTNEASYVGIILQPANGSGSGDQVELRIPTTAPAPPACSPSAAPASAVVGSAVTLSANCSNSPGSYSWTQTAGPSATLSSATAASPTFTPTAAGTYTFSVVATNFAGSSTPASVTVSAAQRPACSPSATPASAVVGSAVTLNANCTGSPTSYSWTQTAGASVALSSATVASPTFTPPTAGSYTFSVVASNAAGASAAASVTVGAVQPLLPPASCSLSAPGAAVAGSSVGLVAACTQGGPPSQYAWRVVSQPASSGVTLASPTTAASNSMTPQAIGTYVVGVVASNAAGAAPEAQATVVVDVAPTAPSACTVSVSPGASLASSGGTVTLTALCGGGAPTSWRWVRGGELLAASGAAMTDTLPANAGAAAVDYTYTMTASNAAGSSQASIVVTVAAAVTQVGMLNVEGSVEVGNAPNSVATAGDGRTAVVVSSFPEPNADGSAGPNLRIVDLPSRTVTREMRVGRRLVSLAMVGDLALAADVDDNALHVVRVATGEVSTIGVGRRPRDIAVLGADRVAVANAGSGDVSFVRVPARSVEQSLRLGIEPRAVVLHPGGRYLYVALGGENALAVVDTGVVPAVPVGRVAVGANPGSIAFSPPGSRAIVTNEDGNSITVLDTSVPAQPSVINTLPIGLQPVRSAFDPRNPRLAYVANLGSAFISVVDTGSVATSNAGAQRDKDALATVLGVVRTENASSDVRFAIGQVMMLVLEYANSGRLLYVDPGNVGVLEPLPVIVPTLAASVLPVSRAVAVDGNATAFATVVNIGATAAGGCGIALPPTIPATLTYQTTNPQTNAVTGEPDTPVALAPGAARSFVFGIRPRATFTETEIDLRFSCASGAFAARLGSVNTFLLSSSAEATPDVVALAATAQNDGIVRVESTGAAAFSVATINVGAAGPIVATAEGRGPAATTVRMAICQTDAAARCLQPPAGEVSLSLGSNQTATFSVFVIGTGASPPPERAEARAFARFRSPAGVSLGATSVALEVR